MRGRVGEVRVAVTGIYPGTDPGPRRGLITPWVTCNLEPQARGVFPNLRFEFLATWPGAILAAGSQRVP